MRRTKPAICSVCGRNYDKPHPERKSIKSYCPDCRGHSTVVCTVCKKEFNCWNSKLRKDSNRVCSIKCKSIVQRIPWELLTRGMLKQRWLKEMGSLKCTRCGHDKPFNIEIHHKIYVKNGGTHNPTNLEPLCRNCHGTEHYENGKDEDEFKH